MRWVCVWLIGASLLLSVPAFAQSDTAWTVASGIAQFSVRDIVGSGLPVDASPVTWSGAGPAIDISHERMSPARLRRFEFIVARAGRFSYDSLLRSREAAGDDHAFSLEGQYEYRRGVLKRKMPSSLDLGIGVRATGAYLSLTRRVDPSLDIGLSTASAGAAFVVAARIGGERRVRADVAWANGILFGSLRPRGGIDSSYASSGGGWQTDLVAGVRVRVASSVAVTGTFFDRGESLLSSHRGFSTDRTQLTVGVMYAK